MASDAFGKGEMEELLNALDLSLEGCEVQTLVIGLSGGLDSVALLETCRRWRDQQEAPPGWVAAHLNHNLRDAADEDEAFCRTFCQSIGAPWASHSVELRASMETHQCGLEEAGRIERHRFFADVCARHPGAVLLLAHHADDQAETILMRMNRGTHLRGLSGMRRHTEMVLDDGRTLRIVRPFLQLWKDDLRRACNEAGLQWREDESNQVNDNPRNQTRNETLPLLKSVLPQLPGAILALADLAGDAESILDEKARVLYDDYATESDGGVVLSAECVEATRNNPHLLRHILRQILEDHFSMPNLSGAHLLSLDRLLRRGRVGTHLQLPGDLRARKESDGLFVYHAAAEPLPPDGELILPAPPFRVEALGIRIEATLHAAPEPIPDRDRGDPCVEWIDAARIRKPMTLRARRAGDRLWPLGASGGKKVKAILIDRKVPQRAKGRTRIVADYAGPLWLWPLCLANRARLTDATRSAVRLRIHPRMED